MKDVVHLSNYASQPSVEIACDGSSVVPAWGAAGNQDGLPEGVHRADDQRLYTFDDDLVTCRACLPHRHRVTKVFEAQGGDESVVDMMEMSNEYLDHMKLAPEHQVRLTIEVVRGEGEPEGQLALRSARRVLKRILDRGLLTDKLLHDEAHSVLALTMRVLGKMVEPR